MGGKEKNKLIMKRFFAVTVLFFCLQSILFAQRSISTISQDNKEDSIAHSIIFKNLDEVKRFIRDRSNPAFIDIGNVVWFLIDLTSIPPESLLSDQDSLNLSIKDYERWDKWYILNKGNIYWDNKNKRILVKKSIRPYIPFNKQ